MVPELAHKSIKKTTNTKKRQIINKKQANIKQITKRCIGNGTSKVRNSENIEGENSANGNQTVLLENRLKGVFVSKNVVNLSKLNLNDADFFIVETT